MNQNYIQKYLKETISKETIALILSIMSKMILLTRTNYFEYHIIIIKRNLNNIQKKLLKNLKEKEGKVAQMNFLEELINSNNL